MILSGAPFAADPLSGLWYPPNWIPILYPEAISFNLLFLIHLIWAGLGMWLLTRQLGMKKLAAFVAALAFCGSPKLVGHVGLGHLGLVSAVCWTPWIVLALLKAIDCFKINNSEGYLYAALTGTLLGLTFLIDPRWFIPVLLLCVVFVINSLYHGNFRIRQQGKALLMGLILVILFSLAVSAVLSVPLAEFTLNSSRLSLDPQAGGEYDLPAARLLGLFFPDYAGWAEWLPYVGLIVLFLAVIALFNPNAHSFFWWGVAIFGWLFALGSQTVIFEIVSRIVPGAGLLRVPPRALFISIFALSILAGYGVENFIKSPEGHKLRGLRLTSATFWVFTLVLSIGIGMIFLRSQRSLMLIEYLHFIIPAFLASLMLVLVFIQLYRPARNRWVLTGMIILLFLDIALIDISLNESRLPDPVENEKVEAIQANLPSGKSRLFSVSYSLDQLEAAEAGLELADGVNPLQLMNYWQFMSSAAGYPLEVYSVTLPPYPDGLPEAAGSFKLDAEKLGWLAVGLVTSAHPIESPGFDLLTHEQDLYIYANSLVRPLAWMQGSTDKIDESWSPVDSISRSINHIEVQVQEPGTLVLSEIHYPGWRAFSERGQLKIFPLENLLRAVELAEGENRVSFTFVPISLYLGFGISIMGILALIVVWRKT